MAVPPQCRIGKPEAILSFSFLLDLQTPTFLSVLNKRRWNCL
jgi:hypothetical protein